jgi:hypothetical protein
MREACLVYHGIGGSLWYHHRSAGKYGTHGVLLYAG